MFTLGNLYKRNLKKKKNHLSDHLLENIITILSHLFLTVVYAKVHTHTSIWCSISTLVYTCTYIYIICNLFILLL